MPRWARKARPVGLVVCVLAGGIASAQAQSCRETYQAIRREAMYCGFFCDWRKIESLQVIYEGRCMPQAVVPISMFDRDSLPEFAQSDARRAAEPSDVAQ
jgi:hypothetical protein